MIDNLYVKFLDNYLSGILTADISDHFPIFVLVGSKHHTTTKDVNVECRKIDDKAINNIKAMLMATDWADMLRMDAHQQCKKIVDVIHEYMNIHALPRVSKLPDKLYMQNKWMTKGLIRSSCQLSKLRKKYIGKPADDEHYFKYINLFNRLIRQVVCLLFESTTG